MSGTLDFRPHGEAWDYYGARSNYHVVQYLRSCGLNIMPLICDGSKAPKIKWSQYQLDPVPEELQKEFFFHPRSASGIGVICGSSSGYLEILDFDGPHLFLPWCKRVAAQLGGDFVRKLVVVQTPKGGWHVYYRCMRMQGNQKLAYSPDGKIQIETRGQGGQAVMPGSPPITHVTGKPYRLYQGSFNRLPMIGGENHRSVMIEVAQSFDKASAKPAKPEDWIAENCEGVGGSDRPGDVFNQMSTWLEVLEPAGWMLIKEECDVCYWRRPGKDTKGISATTGYCHSEGGKELMKVFSSNASPLEEGATYDKFSLYTHLYCEGDFRKSAQELHAKGYAYRLLEIDDQIIKEFFKDNGNDTDTD